MHLDGIEIQTDNDLETAMLMLMDRKRIELKLSKAIFNTFLTYLKHDKELIKKGGKPQIVLAARMYTLSLVCLEPRTQSEVSRAFNVSEGGLRRFFHRLRSDKK